MNRPEEERRTFEDAQNRTQGNCARWAFTSSCSDTFGHLQRAARLQPCLAQSMEFLHANTRFTIERPRVTAQPAQQNNQGKNVETQISGHACCPETDLIEAGGDSIGLKAQRDFTSRRPEDEP